jgi:hypothetical protein
MVVGFGLSVVYDGTYSSSSKICLSKGTMPDTRKSEQMLLGVAASGRALATISGISYMVIDWPELFFIQASCATATNFLNGPKTERSSGCSL